MCVCWSFVLICADAMFFSYFSPPEMEWKLGGRILLIEIQILIPVSHHSRHRRVLWIHHYCKNKNAAAEIYVLINDLWFSFNNELHLRQQEKINGNIETRVSYQIRWKKLCRRKIKAEMYGLSRRRRIMAIIWPRWQLKFFPTTLATSGRHDLAWLLSW